MKKNIQKLSILLLPLLLIVGMIPASVMAVAEPSVSYCTHVQNEGWQDYKSNGVMSGTEGKSYRLEGIKINLENQGYDLGISYQTHIQNIGWEADTNRGWKSNEDMSGTEGLSYRLEAIQIKLTGADADKFDVYYQVHAQNMGWLGLAKNGGSAGTAGYGYRLEGIRIVIVPVGSAAPNWVASKTNPFYENNMQMYQEIINEYRIAGEDICDKSLIDNLPNVNPGIRCKKGSLYYTLKDISGDGVNELIIGIKNSETGGYFDQIYDIYTIIDKKAIVVKRPQIISESPYIKDKRIDIYENMIIESDYDGTYSYYSIYDILPNGEINCIGTANSLYFSNIYNLKEIDEFGNTKESVLTSEKWKELCGNYLIYDNLVKIN